MSKSTEGRVEILLEDERFLGVNKPAGMLTIPGRDPKEVSLVDRLRRKWKRLQVVHRIDRETSGCVLFAKTPDTHRLACGWFEKHEVKKEYLAIVRGVPALPVFKITTPIEGARAITQATVEKRYGDSSLLRVRIVTGKRHQIRIHLTESGFPILGDSKYGGPKKFRRDDAREIHFARVALHAEKLELPTGEKMLASIPEDFANWLTLLADPRGSESKGSGNLQAAESSSSSGENPEGESS